MASFISLGPEWCSCLFSHCLLHLMDLAFICFLDYNRLYRTSQVGSAFKTRHGSCGPWPRLCPAGSCLSPGSSSHLNPLGFEVETQTALSRHCLSRPLSGAEKGETIGYTGSFISCQDLLFMCCWLWLRKKIVNILEKKFSLCST